MIKKIIKNIINLTKILFKNSFQNPYLFNKNTNKINKKSIFLWLIIIVMIAITFVSYKGIGFFIKINQPEIFLNIVFLIMMVIILFQVILSSSNVYYFSSDFEQLLPLPIKPIELLLSKFNTIVINMYFSEFIFVLFPIIIYGIMTNAHLMFFIYAILILLIFPILPALIISIIMMILMKLSKFIKNKDIFQIVITLIFIALIFLLEFKIMINIVGKISNNSILEEKQIVESITGFDDKIKNINKYFLEINPTINILRNYNKINSIIELIKIIFIDFIFLIIFIFSGKKIYLKNILKNNNYYNIKKINNIKIEKKCKKRNKGNSYILKELKSLFKNPTFFMQCIFPTLIIIISIAIIMLIAMPSIKLFFDTILAEQGTVFFVDISVICLILGIIQIVFTMTNISITAISREGKNASYMKFVPVDFYKQFKYKSIPQIIINLFLILIIIIFIKNIFPTIEIIYLIYIFILANILNIINSNLMLLVDLINPNLNWDSEYEVVKQNNNKLYQYVLTIIIILLLTYFSKIFMDINLIFACNICIIILIIILLIINIIIKLNINKLFKKIN